MESVGNLCAVVVVEIEKYTSNNDTFREDSFIHIGLDDAFNSNGIYSFVCHSHHHHHQHQLDSIWTKIDALMIQRQGRIATFEMAFLPIRSSHLIVYSLFIIREIERICVYECVNFNRTKPSISICVLHLTHLFTWCRTLLLDDDKFRRIHCDWWACAYVYEW